jgi:RNA polymerase sigma-70 factor, ECF subfamily
MASPNDPPLAPETAEAMLARGSLDDRSLAAVRSAEDGRLLDTLERARRGSRGAFDQLFAQLLPRLHTWIRVHMDDRLRDRVDSLDVLQETLLRAFRGLDGFRGSGQRSLMGWLHTIAVHEVRRAAQHHGRQRRALARELRLDDGLSLADAWISVEASLSRRHDLSRLEVALRGLEEEQRRVLLLRAFEGHTFGEIGATLGKSADASRMQYARALAALTVQLRARSGAPTREA